MTLLRDLRRLGALVLAPVALSAALLTACGGGTSQVVAFHPDKVIAFGDESSMIVDNGAHDGLKYGINDRSTVTTTGNCLLLPTFVQSLAGQYGYVFEQCNVSTTTVTPKAFIRAEAGATVTGATGLAYQLDQQGSLTATDLVSVMIGTNDVIALYELVVGDVATRITSAEAVVRAQTLGAAAATLINDRILAAGAKAIVVTIPDLGLSPYALNANKTNPGASALLSTLSYEFNAYLRTRIDSTRFDGRNYGLVLADDIVAAMAKNPSSFLSSPYNATEAACKVTVGGAADVVRTELLACRSNDLAVTANTANAYLWASDRHLGPNAHSRIGSQAQSRAVNNPF